MKQYDLFGDVIYVQRFRKLGAEYTPLVEKTQGGSKLEKTIADESTPDHRVVTPYAEHQYISMYGPHPGSSKNNYDSQRSIRKL